jgi:hypothetical protein
MNQIVSISLRFLLLFFLQVLVLNNLEIGWGTYIMVYPFFILLLPFEMGVIPLMLISFFMGISIDSLSNTFGMHASAAVLVAYLRPFIFKAFAPRDGYDSVESAGIRVLGFQWLLGAYGTLLVIHHLWFFILESLQLNEILLILRKVGLSVPLSFAFSLLVQFIFMRRRGE